MNELRKARVKYQTLVCFPASYLRLSLKTFLNPYKIQV